MLPLYVGIAANNSDAVYSLATIVVKCTWKEKLLQKYDNTKFVGIVP